MASASGPRVLTLDETARFWSKVDKSGDCWLWTGSVDGYGYGMVRVPAPSRVRRAHRVAYELTHGPVADGTVFLHACDTPACVRPDHLRPGTRAENNADRDAKGRHVPLRGERHPAARLTRADVEIIRAATGRGVSKQLAEKYGVSLGHIYNLRSKKALWIGDAA